MVNCDINAALALVGTQPTNLGAFKVGLAIYGKLCQLLQQYDEMASCDINEAIARAGCCPDASPYKLLQAIFGKLCDVEEAVENGGGGGGATCIACADHDPVDGVDIPPCDCSIMVAKTVNNTNLWGSNDGATWFPIIYGG